MEQEEDRKKKVAAGKEKLAAFRRKRAKKKKAQGDGGEGGMADGSHSNGTGETNLVDVSSASDFNSVTGESDQFSLTSGDEWSAEEPELHSAVFYQAKLAAATQRIAELEEAVEGKQLALDSMVQEMQSPSSPLSHKYPAQADASDGGDGKTFETRGTVFDLHEAVAQRDKILRQLTNRLQETATSAHSRSQPDGTLDYSLETERLSQQVAVLQQQLAQVRWHA
nr:hypothetical protein BaRGS_025728 [Batillaria attramentaria]